MWPLYRPEQRAQLQCIAVQCSAVHCKVVIGFWAVKCALLDKRSMTRSIEVYWDKWLGRGETGNGRRGRKEMEKDRRKVKVRDRNNRGGKGK